MEKKSGTRGEKVMDWSGSRVVYLTFIYLTSTMCSLFFQSHHEPPPFPQLSLWTLNFCCVAGRNCDKAIRTKNSTLAKVQVCIFDPRGKKKTRKPQKKKTSKARWHGGFQSLEKSFTIFYLSTPKKKKTWIHLHFSSKTIYRPQKKQHLGFWLHPPPKEKKALRTLHAYYLKEQKSMKHLIPWPGFSIFHPPL